MPQHLRADLSQKIEMIDVGLLKPHPRNYRAHPEDQIAHLIQSIQEHGFYRNVIIAQDNVILAGHGITQAAERLGIQHIPVIRLNIASDDVSALQVLIGDNEIARLAMINDRLLTDMLKEMHEHDVQSLQGTGFDEQMLAALTFVTRPKSEIRDKNEASEWIGMPEYEPIAETLKMVISFRTAEDRAQFAQKMDVPLSDNTRQTISVWWPAKEKEDLSSFRFEG